MGTPSTVNCDAFLFNPGFGPGMPFLLSAFGGANESLPFTFTPAAVSGVPAPTVGCAVESTLELVGEAGSAVDDDSCGNLRSCSFESERVINLDFGRDVVDAFVGGAIVNEMSRFAAMIRRNGK